MKKLSLCIAIVLLLCGCRKIEDTPGYSSVETTLAPETTVYETEPETETEAVTEPIPDPSNDGIVSIIMAGDVLLHDKIAASGKMADGTYNYDHLFSNVTKEITDADIAIVNQEVILGGKELGLTGYPSFNGAHEVGDSLVKSGFDVVLHATNHALDKGKKGLLSCIDFWENSYPEIEYLGIHSTAEDQKEIFVTEKEGIRFAILNYTYGTNGIALPYDMPYCVDLLDENKVRNDIARAKEISDFVIVCPHWGTEYILKNDSYQAKWANIFFECGVDLVIGTHPHVIEPVEVISDGNHTMTVYYSIGNFVNSTAQTGAGIANRMVGALATVTVSKTDSDAVLTEYGVIPVVAHVKSGAGQPTVYKLSDYTEELASQNEIISSDPAFSLSYCIDLCQKVFGDLYSN